MTEILIYNTPNSEEILRNIYKFEFQRAWKPNLTKNNKNLFWGIVFISLAIFLFIYKQHVAYFFAGLALMYILIFINYLAVYKKHKKKLDSFLEEEIKSLNKNSKDVIWEFAPDHFRFRNYKHDFTFNWEDITYCILQDRYLYITTIPNLNFILDKANTDEINFQKTIDYLNDKSKIKAI